MIKIQIRKEAAVRIQSVYRGWILRTCWPIIVKQLRETLRKTTHHPYRSAGCSRKHTHDSGYNTPAPVTDEGAQGHCRTNSNEILNSLSTPNPKAKLPAVSHSIEPTVSVTACAFPFEEFSSVQ